jgi:pyruvate/oxaloacetate carboxyltransferase
MDSERVRLCDVSMSPVCLSVAQASSLSLSLSLSHARSTMQIDAVVKTTTTTTQQCRTKYHRGIAYIHIERDSEIKRTGCASGARRQRMQLQAEAKARDLCDERVNVDENVQNP